MRNLKLILSYDGSDFAGWQVQPDALTAKTYCRRVLVVPTRECMR